MKPLIQRLPIDEQTSFVARIFTTPLFETTWHQHEEFELILQIKGKGMCFVGNYIGEFKAGDIFFLGANLPHEFKKEQQDLECSVLVIHFKRDFWGKDFLAMPECREIRLLFEQSMMGIKLSAADSPALARLLRELETSSGFNRIQLLTECLNILSRETQPEILSTAPHPDHLAGDRINKVFAYTIENFRKPISLQEIAGVASLSVSAFCRYFKKNTKKSYIEFLNEMRIGYACQALMECETSISQICYECGFSSIANFNKQFLKIKGRKPMSFKKRGIPAL